MKPNEIKLAGKVKISTLLAASLVVLFGCNRDDMNRSNTGYSNSLTANSVDNEAINIAQDAGLANASFNEVTNDVQEIIGVPNSILKSDRFINYCTAITVTPSDSVYPRTITLAYGTSGCINLRGEYKTGKIIINISAAPTDSLSMVTITFDSLVINGNKVEGTKTMQYLGRINGNPTWKNEVIDGKITTPGGRVVTHNVKDRILSLITGQNTPNNFWDNVYSLSGTSMGTNAKDTSSWSYSDSIPVSNPLIIAVFCRHPQGGQEVVNVSKNGKVVRTVDLNYGRYIPGSTSCKGTATLNINGKIIYSYPRD